MNHPELTQLWEYLEGPEAAPQAATLDHLTECAVCRTRAARLATLQSRVQQMVPRLGANAYAESDALEVARWVDAATDIGQDMAHDPRLRNPAGLKAALHYAVHRSALQRDLPDARPAPAPRAQPAGPATLLIQRIAKLFTWRAPLWIPAAAAALVWAALGLPLLTTDTDSVRALPLVSYQDSPVMRFQSAGAARPGIGFFSAANITERPFTGVQLTRPQAGTLELRWPVVENAVQYRVTLHRNPGPTREAIAEQIATMPHAIFNNFDFAANRRYEWEISGSTRDGATFRASGGFVVPKSQHPAGRS
jgi:hypothetical protein